MEPVRALIEERFGYDARFSHFPILGLCADCAREELAAPDPPRGVHAHDRPPDSPCTSPTASSAPGWPPSAGVVAIAAVAYALRVANVELDEARVPLLGVLAAFIFAAQMLNFPIAGGTSGHLLGATLAAVLLGPWLACLVMAVVLIVQCFAFADGGVSALGANILNMGVLGALLAGYLVVAAREGAAPHARWRSSARSGWSRGWR